MRQKTKISTLLAIVVIVFTGCALRDKFHRIQYATSLFSGKEQYENFARIPQMFPVTTLATSNCTSPWPAGSPTELPIAFEHQEKLQPTQAFLDDTDTVALLVIHQGQVRYENYWLTGGLQVQWPSWSVAKSFISALIGIAVEERLIAGVDQPVTDYLPELKGSGYDGVSIRDILQMSSGARWNEDYSDWQSDINRLGRILALGGSLDRFIASIGPDLQPGTYNRYNSADTQVLGRLITAVSGRSLSSYMSEKIWQPLCAEAEGHWLIDDEGMEMAFAGFHATARDYARLGELYRLNGNWQGKQLLSPDWIKASTTAKQPHLLPGDNPNSNNQFGYGYQWWLLDGKQGEFVAMGVYNQFIYVNPQTETVIVKLSANSQFGVTDDQSSYRDQETISMLRAINQALLR